MSLFVAEGCDGSGKTRLIGDIAHVMPDNVTTLHRGPLKRDPMLEYVGDLMSYLPGKSPSILCDRWHLGEMVYGPLYRGESKITPAMNLFIDLFLDSRGACRMWMDTPYEIVSKRLSDRGEDFLLEQHQRLVVDWYAEALLGDTRWIAVPTDRRPSFVERIKDSATILESQAAYMLERWPSYIGSMRNVDVLIIGDQKPMPIGSSWSSRMIPWRNSPMHDILTAMVHLNYREIGIINSTRNLKQLWLQIGAPATVFVVGSHQMYMHCMVDDIPAKRLSLPPKGIPITQLIANMESSRA